MTTPVPDASTSDSESVALAELAGEVGQTEGLGLLVFGASFEMGVLTGGMGSRVGSCFIVLVWGVRLTYLLWVVESL